jgi:hypothetical protein
LLDAGNGAFEVVERTAAPRTGYVFGFAGTDASCLQDTESRGVYNLVVYRLIAFLAGLVEKENTVAEPVRGAAAPRTGSATVFSFSTKPARKAIRR